MKGRGGTALEGVSVVIPAYNEALRLPATLAALRALALVSEIIVVDDGSTDGTGDAARGDKTEVVRMPHNRGKGAALGRGVERARFPVVVLLDADLGDSASLAPALVEPVRRGEADVAVASFSAERPAGMGLVQTIARRAVLRLGGRTFASPLSGQRAMHRRVLAAIGGFASGFGAEVAFTIDALRAGFRVVEVPLPMTHRETGRDAAGFFHRGRQLWHVTKAVLPRVWTEGRRRALRAGAAEDGP